MDIIELIHNIPVEIARLTVLDRLYSTEYKKEFIIQHDSKLLRLIRKNCDDLSYITQNYSLGSLMEYAHIYASTEAYNQDIGLDENMRIPLSDIRMDLNAKFIPLSEYKGLERKRKIAICI
jgi:hypothetical protein